MYRCDINVDNIVNLEDHCKINYFDPGTREFTSIDTYISREEYAIKNITLKARLNGNDNPRIKTIIYRQK